MLAPVSNVNILVSLFFASMQRTGATAKSMCGLFFEAGQGRYQFTKLRGRKKYKKVKGSKYKFMLLVLEELFFMMGLPFLILISSSQSALNKTLNSIDQH
jgi:hypothetical protein